MLSVYTRHYPIANTLAWTGMGHLCGLCCNQFVKHLLRLDAIYSCAIQEENGSTKDSELSRFLQVPQHSRAVFICFQV